MGFTAFFLTPTSGVKKPSCLFNPRKEPFQRGYDIPNKYPLHKVYKCVQAVYGVDY